MTKHDPQQPHYTCPTCGAYVLEEGQFCQPSCRPDHDFFLSRKLTVVPIGETRFEIHEEYAPIRTRRVAFVHCGLLSPKGARDLAELFAESPSIKHERDLLWRILHRFIEALSPTEEDVETDRQLADDFRVAYPRLVKDARELLKKLEEENEDS